MSLDLVLLIVFILLIVGAFPQWPHSRSWGYTPLGILTALLAVFLIWAIVGKHSIFKSSGQDIQITVEDAGRGVADSIRRTVQ